MGKVTPEAQIEAILFAFGDPVRLSVLAKAVEKTPEETKKIIEDMITDYEVSDRGITIIQIENSYQMATKRELHETLEKIIVKEEKPKLTPVAMEVLSIIAYKQPVTKAEIEQIRGVRCDHAINKLVDYNLIKEVGHLQKTGTPALFGVTEEFYRAMNISGIQDLPGIDEEALDKLREEASRNIPLTLGI